MISISTIIPAYNLENCIRDCLDSVVAQKIEDSEIIPIDNGSADNTGKIIAEYAKKYPNIHPVYLEKNAWPSGARNAGLDIAQGEFIHFCDGDDEAMPGAYEELLKVARRDNADVVTGNYSRKYPNEHNAVRQFSYYKSSDAFERCFESGNTTLWNKIFRRSIIEEQHLRFSMDLRYSEDVLFYMLLMIKLPVAAYTDKSVYIYTEPTFHKDSDIDSCAVRYASFRCIEDHLKMHRAIFEKNETDPEHKEIWFDMYSHNLWWQYECSWRLIQNADDKRKAFEILRNAIIDLQSVNPACDWRIDNRMEQFLSIFHIDFSTFCTISYADYCYVLALKEACHRKSIYLDRFLNRSVKNDDELIENINKRLEKIKEVYSKKFSSGLKEKRDYYWNAIQDIFENSWLPMIDAESKASAFKYLKEFMVNMSAINPLCSTESEFAINRFKNIFVVDLPAMETLGYNRYLTVLSLCGDMCNVAGCNVVDSFIDYCQRGKVGMRTIVKSGISWLKYKMSRK